MSYRCEICEKDQPRHNKPVRVVVAWKWVLDKVTGKLCRQIAEEKNLCPACARALKEKGERE